MKNQGRRTWPQISLIHADQGKRKLLYQRRSAQSVYPVKYLPNETQPWAVKRQRVSSGDEVSSVADLTGAAKISYSVAGSLKHPDIVGCNDQMTGIKSLLLGQLGWSQSPGPGDIAPLAAGDGTFSPGKSPGEN